MLSVSVPKTCYLACSFIERSRGAPEHKKEPWAPGLDFCRFWDLISRGFDFFGTTKDVFCNACSQVTIFSDLGVLIGRLGLQNQAFGAGRVEKTAFHICWDSVDFDVVFSCFFYGLEPISISFGALDTGLKFNGFR